MNVQPHSRLSPAASDTSTAFDDICVSNLEGPDFDNMHAIPSLPSIPVSLPVPTDVPFLARHVGRESQAPSPAVLLKSERRREQNRVA